MKIKITTVGILLASLLSACGGGGGGGGTTAPASAAPAVTSYSLSGQFQKGPFALGSQISANMLDSSLNPTGQVYNVQTTDDLGHFSVPTSVPNKLVELVGDGFYMDELTGQLSSARIQLRAVTDLSVQSSVTVNILTSLQELRLKQLLTNGASYAAANVQSRNEVLLAFGVDPTSVVGLANLFTMDISGSTDADAVLLAISAVLSKMASNTAATNGTSQPAELSNYVNNIASQLQTNGTITNAGYSSAISLASTQINVTAVRSNVQAYYASKGITIVAPKFEEWVNTNGSGTLPQRLGTGNWQTTGQMTVARSGHTATLLPNGKVLISGGQADLLNGARLPIGSAELYDPITGTWSGTGSLAAPRSNHTATLLPNGSVLVVGGTAGNGQTALGSAEIYDPATSLWSATGSLNTSRWGHTATLLVDGRVLVTGGDSNDSATASAEIYDPASGQWTVTANLSARRMLHTATLLQNGKVLVAAGFGWPNGATSAASAEIYDPSTGLWSTTGAPISIRSSSTATLLSNGKVLLTGGVGATNTPLSNVEIFDPTSGTWTTTGPLNVPRTGHTSILMPNGYVAVIGGGGGNGQTPLGSGEIYSPSTGLWTLLSGSLATPRGTHDATLLPSGRVLITGGTVTSGTSIVTSTAELYW